MENKTGSKIILATETAAILALIKLLNSDPAMAQTATDSSLANQLMNRGWTHVGDVKYDGAFTFDISTLNHYSKAVVGQLDAAHITQLLQENGFNIDPNNGTFDGHSGLVNYDRAKTDSATAVDAGELGIDPLSAPLAIELEGIVAQDRKSVV